MARKVGQIIARRRPQMAHPGYFDRDHETKKRNYDNRTTHGPMREAQACLTRKLRERDLGRDLEGAKITLNEYLDRGIKTAVKPRVREKTWLDLNACYSATSDLTWAKEYWLLCVLDIQTTYQQMIEPRPVRSNRPLSTRRVKVCNAAGIAVASVA